MSGPSRTGSVEPFKRKDGQTYFRARIRLADGSRIRVDVPEKYCTPAGGKSARERATLYASALQEREDETGAMLAERTGKATAQRAKHDAVHGETAEQYFKRFTAQRSAIGKVKRIRDLESAWNTWLSDEIGRRPIAGLTREHVEDVRDLLDAQVAKRKAEGGVAGLSGARARNVWSVLTSMMKEACSSKRRDLRVRADNPCAGVQPPEKTDPRVKTFVYPSEFLTLASCEAVPLEWRELYACACYLFLRPGELRALKWSDIDFHAGVVHVTKAYDEDSQSVGPPKTRNGVRDVPIPEALVPLLRLMKERKASSLVAPLLESCSERRRAGVMRKHFTLAKLSRARLTEQTTTTRQIDFRSWRDTGITWLALAGVDVAKMQRRCGHDEISTTLGYVKMAEDFSGSIGEPFPPLPKALVGDAAEAQIVSTTNRPNRAINRAKSPKKGRKAGYLAERAGVEPAVDF